MLPEPKPQAKFLNAETLAKVAGDRGWAKLKVTGEPKMGKYGVDVPGTIAKDAFILTLNTDRQDYSLVANALGRDPEDWMGHTIKVTLREGKDKKTGEKRNYVNIIGVE